MPVAVSARGLLIRCAGWTVEQVVRCARSIRARSHRYAQTTGRTVGRLMCVDYLQKIRNPDWARGNRNIGLGWICEVLSNYAQDEQSAVVLFSQVNRETEKSGDNVPRLHEARDSGEYEQHVKFALGLKRPWVYDEREDPCKLEMHVLKNHNGPANGVIEVYWEDRHPQPREQPDRPATAPHGAETDAMTILASILVSDPAWSWDDDLPGDGRGSAKHYLTPKQNVRQIVDYLRPVIEEQMLFDARLAMWRVAAMQQEALDVIRTLGFTVKAEMVWAKYRRNGNLNAGMGHQVRNAHEICLIATRGQPEERRSKGVRSVFFEDEMPNHSVDYCGENLERCPNPERHKANRPIHSAKPGRFYEILEELYEGPFRELNARRRRPGWIQEGDELPPEAGSAPATATDAPKS
jgi:N6-adenosine-specific RNA methylase IME4